MKGDMHEPFIPNSKIRPLNWEWPGSGPRKLCFTGFSFYSRKILQYEKQSFRQLESTCQGKKYCNIEIYPGHCGLLEQTMDYPTASHPAPVCKPVVTERVEVSGWISALAPRTVGLKNPAIWSSKRYSVVQRSMSKKWENSLGPSWQRYSSSSGFLCFCMLWLYKLEYHWEISGKWRVKNIVRTVSILSPWKTRNKFLKSKKRER